MYKAVVSSFCLSIVLLINLSSATAQCTAIIQPSSYPRSIFGIVPIVSGCDSTPQTRLEVASGTTVYSYTYQWQYKATSTGTFSNLSGLGARQSFFYPVFSGYYRLMGTGASSCVAYSDSIQAIIFTKPPLQITPSNPTMCIGGSTNLCVSVNNGNTSNNNYYKRWYYNGTSVSSPTDTISCRTASALGTYLCLVTDINDATCTDTVSKVVTSAIVPPNTSNVTYCQGATAAPLTATGSNLQWYTSPTSTTPLSSAPTPSTSSLGTTKYWVSQTISGCTSLRDSLAVIVVAIPTPPTVSASTISYCQNATASQLSATGTNLTWYTTATGGTALASAPTPLTTTSGTANYWVSQSPNGCSSSRTMITTNVLPIPATPAIIGPSSVCASDTIFLSASTTTASPKFNWTGPHSFADTAKNPFVANAVTLDSGIYSLTVRDTNGCTSLPATLLINVSCPDSVWPGDVNYDLIVDNLDALQLALCLGNTGVTRNNVSTSWAAEYCNKWPVPLPGHPTVNGKHADCDGNGTVALDDTVAITNNYGLVHLKAAAELHSKRTAGQPDLMFDLSGINAVAGQSVTIPILLGSSSISVDSITGIAATLVVEGIVPSSPLVISYYSSWLGNSANTLRFVKVVSNNLVHWTYARTDHVNVSGGGALGAITFTIPNNAVGEWLKMRFSNVNIVDRKGQKFTDFNTVKDSVLISSASAAVTNMLQTHRLTILPNPSSGTCFANIDLIHGGDYTLDIRDPSGKLIWHYSGTGKSGNQSVRLPIHLLTSGVYFVSCQANGQLFIPPVRWIKE